MSIMRHPCERLRDARNILAHDDWNFSAITQPYDVPKFVRFHWSFALIKVLKVKVSNVGLIMYNLVKAKSLHFQKRRMLSMFKVRHMPISFIKQILVKWCIRNLSGIHKRCDIIDLWYWNTCFEGCLWLLFMNIYAFPIHYQRVSFIHTFQNFQTFQNFILLFI